MFKIRTVSPEDATGDIADIYSRFSPEAGVPAAMQLLSASPELMKNQLAGMQKWNEHPTITPVMLKAIRMLLSATAGLDACRNTNAAHLRLDGLTDDQIAAFSGPVDRWPLSEKENRMVGFVVGHLPGRRPAEIASLDQLRGLGWTDPEILEAMAFGGMVLGITSAIAVLRS